MKKLVCFLAVLLLPLAAAADPALTCREVIEQVAVPLALANDPETGVNRSYSAAELAELMRAAAENGIVPDENSMIMQMLKNGHGYFEETAITDLCNQAFGGSWTPEEQDWYEDQIVKIGLLETHASHIPGPENMTYEQAEAFAFRKIREAYGQELALEDRDIWQLGYGFTREDGDDSTAFWNFSLVPQDLEHARYGIEFLDSDPEGSASLYDRFPPDWTQPYTEEQLLDEFRWVYSWNQGKWPQAIWQKLHEMILKAEAVPDGTYSVICNGYRLTEYPEPGPGDISREDAVRIAKDALKKDRAAFDSAVLAEYGGERSWLVGMVIYNPLEGPADKEAGHWAVTVDSKSGTVRGIREVYSDEAFIPEAAYIKAGEGLLTFEDCVSIAAEAVREAYPDVDPLDETEYQLGGMSSRVFKVEFRTKNIHHGDITVTVSLDGTVQEIDADTEPLTGDNLFERYRRVYGYFGQWDQTVWTWLEKDMAVLEPSGIDGKLLKVTHYPEESSVTISRAKAQELGVQATGLRTAEVNTCVLVDAQPHPVWIMRILVYTGDDDPIIGVDAETGEVVFTEKYEVDVTPAYRMYSLPETWRRMEQETAGK